VRAIRHAGVGDMMGKPPRPPAHLRRSTKRWWSWVVETYAMEAHHLKILEAAAETWDRRQEARDVLAKEGAFYVDRWGCPKSHPATAIERDCNVLFLRQLRELRLDVGQPSEDERPPRLVDVNRKGA
jgi:phage terminase small subunit